MKAVRVEITHLRPDMIHELPRYHSAGASGMDLTACIPAPIDIPPGGVVAVPCGIAIAVPAGYEAQVRPRSGLALHNQVTVFNAPGTVDSDYRGEIMVILANFGTSTYSVAPGARIAQLVITPVATAVWVQTDRLAPTDRSTSGFGSTGVE